MQCINSTPQVEVNKASYRKASFGEKLRTRLLPVLIVTLLATMGYPALATVDPDVPSKFESYMRTLQAAAEKEGDLKVCDKNEDAYRSALCRVEILSQQGKFKEAAAALLFARNNLAPPFSHEDLDKELSILNQWSRGKALDAKDYRQFYLETGYSFFPPHLQSIVRLWKNKRFPDKDKYELIAEQLERRNDENGVALAALMAAGSAGADDKLAAHSLAVAGNALFQIGNKAMAEKAWLEARQFPHTLPAWPKAVYNLGQLERGRGNYSQAIKYFQELIASHPNDKEPGSNLMEVYRNYSHYAALDISYCYEAMGDYPMALRYTVLARNRYPYYSWCGTCLMGESTSINRRIAYLATKPTAIRIALVFFVLVGLPFI